MSGRENIVLVTVDSLRADHCGFMGYVENTTPTLDRMAEEGIVFENAIAPGPRTPDSVPTLFTGDRPLPVTEANMNAEQELISNHLHARQTVPEYFERQGYRTAAFTPNPYTSRYFGYNRLFNHFQDFMNEDQSRFLFEQILEGGSLPAVALRLLLSGIQRENVFKPWESYYSDVVRWMRSAGSPYFLWIFLMDCHIPYLADKQSRTQRRSDSYYSNLRWYWNDKDERFQQRNHRRLVAAYDDSVRYVDSCLKHLIRDFQDATVVVTADHGEAFFEHRSYGHDPNALYEENLHVPLVVHSGGEDRMVNDLVAIRDMPELLVSAADGSPNLPQREQIISYPFDTSAIAVRGSDWKYIVRPANDERDRSLEEYYDLSIDPGERSNRIDENPDLLSTARSELLHRLEHNAECRVTQQAIEGGFT